MMRRIGVVSLIGLLALTLTGCSWSWDGSSSEPPPSAPSAPATPILYPAMGSMDHWEPTLTECTALQASASSPAAIVSITATERLAQCRPVLMAQCRVTAVTAYMDGQGFTESEWVAGEENIDPTAAALAIAGAYSFIQGNPPLTHEALGEFFVSDEPGAIAARGNVHAKSPSIDPDVLFDPFNWEIVQLLTGSWTTGNTAFNAGTTTGAGTRENETGDAEWIFIDPDTCTVPVAEVQPPTTDPNDPPAVIMLRPGCRNTGDNLWPTRLFPKDPSKSFNALVEGNIGGGHNGSLGEETGPLPHFGGQQRNNSEEPAPAPTPTGSIPGGDPVPPGPVQGQATSSPEDPNLTCVVVPGIEDCVP